MKVMLGIPFWGEDPHRLKAKGFVEGALSGMYDWAVVGTDTGDYNRGSARNRLVDMAAAQECDVVVLCDADTVPPLHGLTAAITAAWRYGGLQFCYDSYQYLNERGTELLYAGEPAAARSEIFMSGPGSYGGVMAIRPEQWWKAGGSPELEGWGFEDVIFAVQARTLLGESRWHPGTLTHLWHQSEVSVGSDSYNRNIAVCKKFEAVDRDKEALKALMLMGVGNHQTTRLGPVFSDHSISSLGEE